jgi:hypothetical protein
MKKKVLTKCHSEVSEIVDANRDIPLRNIIENLLSLNVLQSDCFKNSSFINIKTSRYIMRFIVNRK